MAMVVQWKRFGTCLTLALAMAPGRGWGASGTPTVEQALKLSPVQADVGYDRPSEKDAARATLKAETIAGKTGWVVRDPSDEILRQFVDTNGDNVVDLWCYFAEGLEVYRDIDANFNGKADQYRWFNTAGSRWGMDDDEDGKIDTWKAISAEEVSAEVVAALAQRDSRRFARLLLNEKELKELGLGSQKAKLLREKIEAAVTAFKTMAASQKAVTAKSQWLQFGGTRPGNVPAGTDGSTKDMLVYENALALVETEGKHSQLSVGTLLHVGDSWRLVEAPTGGDDQAELPGGGLFFAVLRNRANSPGAVGGGDLANDAKTQDMLAKLEVIDQSASKATTPEAQAENAAQRCDLLEKIAESVNNPEDRAQWLRNLAETLAVAVQLGTYPDGAERLKALYERLENDAASRELAAYVKFRYLTAEYNRKLLPENADYAKIQAEWLESLKQFVSDFPDVAETPEAMLQVGNTMEFSGDEAGAKKWYGDIVAKFHDTLPAKKAAGATRRLDSVGKVLEFHGPGVNGKSVDLSQFRSKAVLIQFWATWCEPCKADHELLKEAQAKYGKNFAVISVSLDKDKADLEAYLKRQPLPWPQIYEPGGFDSRLANELGVVTLPTMILVDPSGKVIHRAITASEIDREVRSIVKQAKVAEETPASKSSGKRQKADRGEKAVGKRS